MDNRFLSLIAALALLLSVEGVQANTYLATFAGSTWKDSFSPKQRQETISGSLLFSGPDADTVATIDAISLTVHGHTFGAADVRSDVAGPFLQFGDTDPIGTLFPLNEAHFVLSYSQGSLRFFQFTASDTPGSRWVATDAIGVISAVPVPASGLLALSALALIPVRRRIS